MSSPSQGRKLGDVDAEVGRRIRVARRMKGVTQQRLAKELGVSFQQIQKYEKGATRISVSKLKTIAKFLRVPIYFFFQNETDGIAAGDDEGMLQLLADRDAALLMRAFSRIEKNINARKIVVALVENIAAILGGKRE